jgi:hypothetical protein
MRSQRKSNRSKSVIHRLMRLVDAWTAWIIRHIVEPRTRVHAVARARVTSRRYRGAVDMRKK